MHKSEVLFCVGRTASDCHTVALNIRMVRKSRWGGAGLVNEDPHWLGGPAPAEQQHQFGIYSWAVLLLGHLWPWGGGGGPTGNHPAADTSIWAPQSCSWGQLAVHLVDWVPLRRTLL